MRVVKFYNILNRKRWIKSFYFLILSIAVFLSCKLSNLILVDKLAEGLVEKNANVRLLADVEYFIVLTIFYWSTIDV